MRIALSLFGCMLLVGCPSPKSSPSPDSTPAPAAAAPASSAPAAPGSATPAATFPGVWTTVDDKGQVFDIVIFPNGQAVTNWTTGERGAQGERGFWRIDGARLLAFLEDGWTDVVSPNGAEFLHQGFSPGTLLTAPPTNKAPTRRLDGAQAAYIGVWRMNKEPDGSYLYLALQSNGRAFSTINGGTEGKWELTPKGALCTWPDGWVDIIERTAEGWRKRSWVGAESNTADFSPAERVGEKRFEITP